MLLLTLCIVFLIGGNTNAEICTSKVCEYVFEVQHGRSMTYNKKGTAFNVRLNGTKLVAESPMRKTPPTEFVDPAEVLTLDGVRRNVITVNGTIPGPAIEVMEGAQIVVKVKNMLLSQSVVVHWHGIHQRKTPWMDGVPYLTQCPILPRQSFTYRFEAYPAGTHWYHSHLVSQRNDGLYGILIVHKKMPVMPELNLLVSDWHHADANSYDLLNPYMGGSGELFYPYSDIDYGPDGIEVSVVKYVSSLINGKGRRYKDNQAPLTTFKVSQGKEYRIRTVNVGSDRTYEISVDDHELTVVALDGAEIEPVITDSIIINSAESVDFVINTNKPISSYWIRSATMRVGNTRPKTHDGMVHGTYAILRYEGSQIEEPTSSKKNCSSTQKCRVFNCQFFGYASWLNKECILLNDVVSATPVNELAAEFGLNQDADVTLFLNVGFNWGSSINGRKFKPPTLPYFEPNFNDGLASCAELCTDPNIGCECSNIQAIPLNKTIELIISNHHHGPPAHHGMHLHGHNLAVLKTGYPPYNITTGLVAGNNTDVICLTEVCKKPQWNTTRPKDLNLVNPPIKDVVIAPARGYVIVRFRSTNPGPWLFHCHQATHMSEGMSMIFNEAADYLPPTPKNFPRCHSFDWSKGDFEELMSSSKHSRDSPTSDDVKEEISVPNVIQDIMKEENSQASIPKGEVITQSTAEFIGLILGCTAFGAVLVAVAQIFLTKCTNSRSSSYESKRNANDPFN